MRVKVAVVQTGSLLWFSITSLVQLIKMGLLAGFYKTVSLCWVLQLGWVYIYIYIYIYIFVCMYVCMYQEGWHSNDVVTS